MKVKTIENYCRKEKDKIKTKKITMIQKKTVIYIANRINITIS